MGIMDDADANRRNKQVAGACLMARSIRHLNVRTIEIGRLRHPVRRKTAAFAQDFQLAPAAGEPTSHPTLNSIDQLDLPYVASMDVATLTR